MSLPRIQTIAVGAVPTLIDPLMGIANKISKKKRKTKNEKIYNRIAISNHLHL